MLNINDKNEINKLLRFMPTEVVLSLDYLRSCVDIIDDKILNKYYRNICIYLLNIVYQNSELESYLKEGANEDHYVKGDMFWKEACELVLSKIDELRR